VLQSDQNIPSDVIPFDAASDRNMDVQKWVLCFLFLEIIIFTNLFNMKGTIQKILDSHMSSDLVFGQRYFIVFLRSSSQIP
jgi:hypothetical protein